MGSADVIAVRTFLEESDAHFVSDVFHRASDDSIIVTVSSDNVAKVVDDTHTSLKQLENLKKKINKVVGSKVEYIVFKGEIQERHENSIVEIISNQLDVDVNCNVSNAKSSSIDVWIQIEAADEVFRDGLVDKIKELVLEYFGLHEIDVSKIVTDEVVRDEANLIHILLSVKEIAPINLDGLQTKMGNDYFIPSQKWLQTKLDGLRRNGFLIRQSDGTYVLTDMGLSVTPSGTTRSSSDITRALFLARRKW